MKKYILTYLLLLLFSFILKAQQPSHYLIGEEELAGVDIFSITQDENNLIWLTSSNGVYKYDGYKFFNIKHSSAKSNSLFELIKDNNGEVYCCNLSGQIFKIKNDSLKLFYEIPDSLLSNLIHFNFDNKNRLVFCTKNYYLVDENAEVKFLFPSEYSSNKIVKSKKNELIFIDVLSKQIAYYKNDSILLIEQVDFQVNYPFFIQNKLYLTRSHNPIVYYKNNFIWNKIVFENEKAIDKSFVKFYPINNSLFAFVFKNRGVHFYHKNGSLIYKNSKLFPKYRISSVLNDKEGNIWLTTLEKGIIIIPNSNIVDYNNHPLLKDDVLKTITSDEDGNIYVAGLNGIIYKIKDQKIEIIEKEKIEIEFLKFHSKTNIFIYQVGIISLNKNKEKPLNLPAAKDLCVVDSNHYYIATNQGLFSVIINQNKPHQITSTSINKIRVHCVAYDKKRNEVWTGTTKGLEFISNTNKQVIEHNNQQISVTDIEYINNEIWVSTSNKGILIFKDGKFSRLFPYTTKGKNVHKLVYKNSKIYFTTDDGLNVYSFINQSLKRISKTDGLLSNRIKDFEIINDIVWLILPNGLQTISLNQIIENNTPPTINWTSILVNNKTLKTTNNKFNYTQNQFEFSFKSNAYRHRGELTYKYQLSGLNDTLWQTANYKNNSVKYSSLPYGKYSFNVKAINENNIESKTISYPFSIAPPYWLTWWFFTLCGLFLILIVAIYFIIRLRIIRKRLTLEKQLKTSEITAIKAQMNPHFVFNALNSIQDLIMLKDIRNSNVYLGKFADLMRKTLEFSSKNFIALTDEIETLKLYMELEKLRFGDDFNATINCKIEDNEIHELQIPSMLLQSYVENAIKHGLLHKKGKKELIVNFFLQNSSLICEIIDNGVGRIKSSEIKKRREKSYPSFSTEANKKRIDLIRESTNKNISLKIIDMEANGIAAGTKVVFEFN